VAGQSRAGAASVTLTNVNRCRKWIKEKDRDLQSYSKSKLEFEFNSSEILLVNCKFIRDSLS